jgi:hypothetical protein
MTGRRRPKHARKKKVPGTGMPAADSVTGVEKIRVGKKVQRIIHTTEIDEYEEPQSHRDTEKRRRK